ncbi:MAG: hypothetical protein H0V24_13585 [Chloroflexia bacterium]|nr:hypothetical protein [Chloroflexia bacterium]
MGDRRLPLDVGWERLGRERGIQGTLDPALMHVPREAVTAGAGDVLRRTGGRPGHAFNL